MSKDGHNDGTDDSELRRTTETAADYSQEAMGSHKKHKHHMCGLTYPIIHLHGEPTAEETAKMLTVESMDYAVYDSIVYRRKIAKEGMRDYIRINFQRWTATVLVAFLAGLAAVLVHFFVDLIYLVKFGVVTYILSFDNLGALSLFGAFLFYCLYNTMLITSSSAFITYLVPAGIGSGIPDVKGFLNGNHLRGAFNVKTLFAKFTGVIASVSSGIPTGPEGPMIHMGAIIGAGVSQGRSKTLRINTGLFSDLRNIIERRDFISSGAAAGVSAAFGAPIGGILFSLEEISTYWNNELTWRSFVGCMIATYTVNVGITILTIVKDYLSTRDPTTFENLFYNSNDGLIIFEYAGRRGYYYIELLFFALLGVVGGFLGAFFTFLNVMLNRARRNYLSPHRWARVLEAAIWTFVFSAFVFMLVYFYPCVPTINDEGHIHQGGAPNPRAGGFSFCGDQRNEMAELLFVSQEDAVRNLYTPGEAIKYSPTSLILFFLIYYFGVIFTSGLSLANGLVVPMILIGGSYGRMVGGLVHSMGFLRHIDPGVYALIGSCSFLGGVSRMTIAMTVIMLEITNDIQYLLPIIIAFIFARVVANFLSHPLYDELLFLKSVPLVEETIPREGRTLRVSDVMRSPVIYLPRVVSVADVVRLLNSCSHNAFPIVETMTSPLYLGLISRTYLLAILRGKAFHVQPPYVPADGFAVSPVFEGQLIPESIGSIERVEAVLQDFGHTPDHHTIVIKELNEEELGLYIHLEPWCNRSAICLQERTGLEQAYGVFRMEGLRHIPIVNEHNRVRGIVTRFELLEHAIEDVIHRAKGGHDANSPPDSVLEGLSRVGEASVVSISDLQTRSLQDSAYHPVERNSN
jgi:chloride channel 7